jgi:thiamine monophosphate synthase
MFAFKKKYFLIIESIKDIDLRNIKTKNKYIIIYRYSVLKDSLVNLKIFRNKCKTKLIKFYIANNYKLATLIKSDGLYLSSYNNSFKALYLKKNNFTIIGSAHNYKEALLKIRQGCYYILFSKLFMVNYNNGAKTLGVVKFNYQLSQISHKIIPLGGINISNLNKLKLINSDGAALLSEIKKKPTKIFSRLF